MIIGAHSIIYSTDPDADRAFLRDVLELSGVDAGGGWLVFGLPPAEVAVHPSTENDRHELFLMCDDIESLLTRMNQRAIACDPVKNLRWGLLTRVSLPGGGKLGIYQPGHVRPKAQVAGKPAKRLTKKPASRATKKGGKHKHPHASAGS